VTFDFKGIARRYFEAFSSKDLNVLTGMFADDVTLKDWEIEAQGKEAVIHANKHIFDSVNSIAARPLRIISENDLIAAELQILVNESQVIEVLDLIRFNDFQLITSIHAFKCRQFVRA
jgi:hypothetical protein